MAQQVVHFSPAAFSYARALLELANERKLSATELGAQLGALRDIVEKNESFRLYLDDPAIGSVERSDILQRIFKGRADVLVLDFLRLLNEKARLKLLPEIVGAYETLLKEQEGRVEVDVTVAHALDANQLEQVRKQVGEALKREAVISQVVDESIIGGLLIRVEDRLMDASVRNQLAVMKERLLAQRPTQTSF